MKKKKLSQEKMILNHLLKGRKINALQALQLFGAMRLGAIIFILKTKGYAIKDEWVTTHSGKTIKRYFL